MDLSFFSLLSCARPAIPQPPVAQVPEPELADLERFRRLGEDSGRDAKRRAVTPTPEAGSSTNRGVRIGQAASDTVLLSNSTLSSAMCGDSVLPSTGKVAAHNASSCVHPLPNAKPCWHNLWVDRDALRTERTQFLQLGQEDRSTFVFHNLQSGYYSMEDGDGNRVGKAQWHYFVNGREVCKHSYLLAYPVSQRTLHNMQERVQRGCKTAHDKTEEGGGGSSSREAYGRLSVVGWYQGYASVVGDYMPDEHMTITPRRDRLDEFKEYECALGKEDAVSYEYFCKVVKEDPYLAHIRRARKVDKFSKCGDCVRLNAKVVAAMKLGDKVAIEEAKRERRDHIDATRQERLAYYRRRELGRDPTDDSVSIILDKMDSDKTTSPWFGRAPSWWSSLKKAALQLHVLGVIVHARPNLSFLYVVNDSVKGDANLNIEGLRGTLNALTSMPRTLYIQADNASDNKCWTMIAFLAMLVFHGYVADVYLSFLIVGHTHEDIDQLFSVISRFFKRLGSVLTPQRFMAEISAAVTDKKNRPCSSERIDCVLNWSAHLRPHLVKPLPRGLQHALLSTGDPNDPEEPSVDEVRSPHTFWIHRRPDGKVVMHYKEFCSDELWLPPLNPSQRPWTTTDPDGIVIFRTDPPDPMTNPPSRAPFL